MRNEERALLPSDRKRSVTRLGIVARFAGTAVCLAITQFSAATVPIADAEAGIAPHQEFRDGSCILVRSLFEKPVTAARGEVIGRFDDVVVDFRGGMAKTIAVAIPGKGHGQERVVSIPITDVWSVQRGSVELNMERAQLDREQAWPRTQWPAHVHLILASQLIGVTVRSHTGDTLGRLTDLAVDVRRHGAVYGVLHFSSGNEYHTKLFAIPIQRFMLPPRGAAGRGAPPDKFLVLHKSRRDLIAGTGIRDHWCAGLRSAKR